LEFWLKNVIFAKFIITFVGTGVPDGPLNNENLIFYKKRDFSEKNKLKRTTNGRPYGDEIEFLLKN